MLRYARHPIVILMLTAALSGCGSGAAIQSQWQQFQQRAYGPCGETQFFTDLTWSPDSRQIAYHDGNGSFPGNLFVLDIATGSTDQITHLAEDTSGYVWSPDGSKIAFLTQGSD